METECYLESDFSDICHPHARSGECILMIFKLPRMIIRVVQMRCEKFRYFGELLIILKHPIEHLLLHQDFRKSSFEAVVFEIAKPRTFAMNQNIFSAYQRHLAFPKFRHAFQK